MATVPAGTLMQRAAAGLARRCAQLLADRFGGVYGRRVLLLIGAGSNGGDALFAGARLAARGVVVRALLLDPGRAHAEGLAALRAAGAITVDSAPAAVDLVMDGVVGIGGRGGLRPAAASVVSAAATANASDGGRPIMVAVDVPSGVDPDTGEVPGEAVTADVTVTFGCLKPGLVVGAGAVRAGLVDLVDIGLSLPEPPVLRIAAQADVRGWWPVAGRDSDKYRRGVVGVATGSSTYPGAAVLSVAGASAGPAGMVRYAGSAADYIRQRHPSAVVTGSVTGAGRVQAWVCGSGLGTDERAIGELRAVLAAPVPVCLDADALGLVMHGPVRERLAQRSAPTVVTPHDREFARLAGAPPGADRVASALGLAAQLNVTVLLKGDRTVVASPDGEVWVNPTGTAALASGGTGDVLAGLLGSLLAGGLSAVRAAVAAAYAHGMAGRAAAEDGPVTSADVAAALRSSVGVLLA
ncbi:bifunctional ADP-dependent NAD(P)H-hydrate dehydratase/NAD(P)H-hydrate epimerase [Rugosimonospora acidiphila]|uniref:ADP-dependent (S)-NAD(P)H-hydrate dehydratase n=1 Tax=Rugosimonospora acidiphila TaxID=556531 RepID=A0ABP9RJT8_9ACTN